MSGHSSGETCPNCGANGDHYSDHKPQGFLLSWFWCGECGLSIQPEVKYMDLGELNDYREGNRPFEEEPYEDLDKLPPQKWQM